MPGDERHLATARVQAELPAAGRQRTLHAALACFCAVAFLLAALYFAAWAAALLTAGMGALAVLYLGLRREPFDLFEVFLPFSLLYMMYFGVGTVYFTTFPQELRIASLYPYLLPACALAAAGYGVFVLGYGLPRARPGVARWELRSPWVAVLAGLVGLVGVLAGLRQLALIKTYGEVAPLLSAASHAVPLFDVAWFWWWYAYLKQGRRRGMLLAGVCLGAMAVAILLLSFGSKARFLELAGIPLIALWYSRRRFPWRAMAVLALVAVFVLFPVYNTYKNYSLVTWEGWAVRETLEDVRGWDWEQYKDSSLHALMRRLGMVMSVAAVIRDVGHTVDYERGRTLVLGPISVLIPRVLWPGKPVISLGGEFGQRFHLIHPLDDRTAIAPTLVGELYWNWGVPAVLLGMGVAGISLRWFYEHWGRHAWVDPVRGGFYVSLLVHVMHFETNTGQWVAGFFKIWLVVGGALLVGRGLGLVVPARREEFPRT